MFHFKRLLAAVAITAAAVIVSCVPNLYKPVQEDAAFMQSQKISGWKAVEFSDLNKGRKMYIETCAGCHYLHYPDEYKREQWDTILPSMQRRARGKIADTTAGYILKYLYIASLRSKKTAASQ